MLVTDNCSCCILHHFSSPLLNILLVLSSSFFEAMTHHFTCLWSNVHVIVVQSELQILEEDFVILWGHSIIVPYFGEMLNKTLKLYYVAAGEMDRLLLLHCDHMVDRQLVRNHYNLIMWHPKRWKERSLSVALILTPNEH